MKKQFTPIAMICNKEQFEAIKPKLKGMEIGCISNFNEWNYLVNNADGDPFVICNTGKSGSKRCNREIHETWNERIFLNACGIETFEITKEQILELSKESSFTNATLNKWFPEVFGKKLETGKWYWRDEDELAVYNNGNDTYGFVDGDFTHRMCFSVGIGKEATEQEVFEALKNEAVKRGFVEGAYFKNVAETDLNSIYILKENEFRFGYSPSGNSLDCPKGKGLIFESGVWATIIPTKTKEEAEKLLNCKII